MTTDLEAIKARVEAATPGPWEWINDQYLQSSNYGEVIEPGCVDCSLYCYGGLSKIDISFENADFIAHARQDIPDLIAEVEQLRGKLAQAVDLLTRVLDDHKATGCRGCGRDGCAECAICGYAPCETHKAVALIADILNDGEA